MNSQTNMIDNNSSLSSLSYEETSSIASSDDSVSELARKLRRAKRRLFLQAVGLDQMQQREEYDSRSLQGLSSSKAPPSTLDIHDGERDQAPHVEERDNRRSLFASSTPPTVHAEKNCTFANISSSKDVMTNHVFATRGKFVAGSRRCQEDVTQ